LRLGNTRLMATRGITGVYAPGVTFTGDITLGDVVAADAAKPVFVVGAVDRLKITGGDLWQPNQAGLEIGGVAHVEFVNGTTSHGELLPAQPNRTRFLENGVDVTERVLVAP
jgi:hypothetical protein